MEETWKDIRGYKGSYQISNLGRVKSLPKKYTPREKILKGGMVPDGYLTVTLYPTRKVKKTHYIHILVASHFIPNPEKKRDVNHKDGIKTNNEESNLEWMTPLENTRHAISMELRR